MMTWLQETLIQYGLTNDTSKPAATGLALLLVFLLAYITDIFAKPLLLKLTLSLSARTKTTWDDALGQNKVFSRLAHLAPIIVVWLLLPLALRGYPAWIEILKPGLTILLTVIGLSIIDAFLNTISTIYETFEVSKEVPIRAFIQALKIVIYFLGAILIISALLDETPFYLLSGLGALTAVFMLIFKDAILGFVAGIQLTANKMVTHGDWIEMPKYGADGDVLEVSLTTVKIQNWDKTITTIPTYALISESFKNWRGMSEAGGRRIKRAITIDMSTIQFCSDEMIEKFLKIRPIRVYIETKMKELTEYNTIHDLDDANIVNRRRLSNIGTFRAYVVAYLENHPKIHQDMTFLVRQLAPGEHGLPIEIYVFCNDTDWARYEVIQADIFDHLLAAVPEFGLKVFQNPTGNDFKGLGESRSDR
ncbi:Small-conductance mechanosensitive channel [hydrothermal vent metagenome]|uniref:Small-conductance mechanosensitive channel n=1 Tax=hydrothermal vent metagenome TaxID=652676 RepID=A0A3B1CYL4_9ZZZZ